MLRWRSGSPCLDEVQSGWPVVPGGQTRLDSRLSLLNTTHKKLNSSEIWERPGQVSRLLLQFALMRKSLPDKDLQTVLRCAALIPEQNRLRSRGDAGRNLDIHLI